MQCTTGKTSFFALTLVREADLARALFTSFKVLVGGKVVETVLIADQDLKRRDERLSIK